MKKINKISVIVTMASIAIIGVVNMSTHPATLAQESSGGGVNCITEMRPFLDQKTREFQEYLKTNFQNKSTNTSLLDLALKRFELYKNDLMQKYMSYYNISGFSLESEAMGSFACNQQMQTEIARNENLLKKYFTQTSNIKTSSALMQKLKAINKQLDKLATSVAQMYGKYETFNNNVPCIIEKCI